jgi:hypothetical protein
MCEASNGIKKANIQTENPQHFDIQRFNCGTANKYPEYSGRSSENIK